VAQAIAGRVEVTVTRKERARLLAARQVSPEVYESYLKGRFTEYNSGADVEKSIAYFEEAIKKDPAFAPAYVGLTSAYDELGSPGSGGAPPSELRPKVISATRKALELDPALPEAHARLAHVYQEQWQWSDAEGEYKLALELNPNDAGAHLAFAGWLLCQGRTEEALAWSGVPENWTPLVSAVLALAGSYSSPVATMKPFANCEAFWRCTRMVPLIGSWVRADCKRSTGRSDSGAGKLARLQRAS